MTITANPEALAPTFDGLDEGLEITRRLSDKILAAFNHAYAIGEVEIAQKLRDVLRENEKNRIFINDKREGYDPLGQADLWVEFVEARNRYKQACEHHDGDAPSQAEALESMKHAYKLWSMG